MTTNTLVKVREATQSRPVRGIAIALVVLIAIYGLIGFFAAPPLIRHVAEGQLSEALGRPAHIGRVAFNPYALRLEADRIRVDEKGGAGAFFSTERLVVRLSWFSLLRFAPIVDEVKLDSPQANIVRYDAQRFNFTDIVEKFSKPSKPSGGPTLFSVSNIDVENGRIDFDDRLLGRKHVIDQLSLGVPFIATLPSQSDIFVDPRFDARIDGSLIRIGGKTKPFAASRESDVELKFDSLDVPQLLSYLPAKLPVTVQTGKLAGDLKLNFVMAGEVPTLTVTGTTDLTAAQVVDAKRAPLFAARAVHVVAASLEPFQQVFHFDEIRLDQPSLHVARERSGELSVASALTAPSTAASSSAASAAPGASEAAAVSQAAAPLDVSIKHFALNDGDIALDDRAPAQPVSVSLTHLMASLDDFSTLSKAPARYAVRTALAQGGKLEATGSLGLAAKVADMKLTADALPLTLVQPYLDDVTAARIEAGTLGTTLTVKADWSKAPSSVQVSAGDVTLKSLKVEGPAVAAGQNAPAPAIAFDEGHVAIKQVDLAARRADIAGIDVTGLSVKGARSKDGRIDLATLAEPPHQTREAAAKTQPARTQTPQQRARERSTTAGTGKAQLANASSPGGAQPAWHYIIEVLRLKNGSAQIVDDVPAHPATLGLSSIQLDVRNVSDDMSRPLPVKFAATLNGKGTLEVSGDVVPSPLDASLTLHADRLDLAAFEPYLGNELNATIASALLNAWGDVKLGMAGDALNASYKGGAALTDVRLLDRVTSAPLAGWRSLALARANVHYDGRSADIDIGRVTFTQFFGSVLLDAQGKLNLHEVLAREKTSTPPNTATHNAGSTTVARVHETSPRPGQLLMRAHVGELVLQQGRMNYTDNFVKPNYSAKLVGITGTIGAFGTDVRAPARVDVGASLANNGPISIRGNVNPLMDKPSLDLSVSAHDVELRNLTPYSLKYAGYPITKGNLNVDLHYTLENDLLTANNHLFITQLTFGEHVNNDTATKLPVRLAIALLKNSRGEIDVNIPVSGSLSDPQFSLGSLIWGAVVHLVERAVSAPFTLLANAFGGGGGNADAAEQLRYVAFAPGSAALTNATRGKLDTLAKLLTEKAEVKLELTGRADPAIDTPGLRVAYVDDLVRKEKAQALAGHDQSVDVSTVKVDAHEYGGYLKEAYKNADFQKPRNLIGLTKSLPDDDMKRMLADHAPINEVSLRTLAQQRAEQVRQYLGGKVDAQRISIAAPKLGGTDVKDNGPTTRVDFGLQ